MSTVIDDPHEEHSERHVLSAMIKSADTVAELVEILRPEYFYRPAHVLIYVAILDLYAGQHPLSPVAVREQLEKAGNLEKAGGADYVLGLADTPGSIGSAERHAERIAEAARRRRLARAATRIERLAHTDDLPIDDLIGLAQAEILDAAGYQDTFGLNPIADIMEGVLDEAEAIGSTIGRTVGVPTGFEDLDALTGGLHPGQLIVVASRPAMGKSVLALDIVRAAAIHNGLPAALFTMELGRNEVGMRLLSAEARVALHHMRAGTLTDADWTRVAKRMPDVTNAPLYIDDSDSQTLTDIRAKARRLKQQHGLSLVVVDSVQLLKYGLRQFSSRYEEINEISRHLKIMARELEVPVIAVSQINRGPEQRTDKRPMLYDLRDSGTLEDDADLVLLLHREDAYEKESPRAGEADFIVAKHRMGPTATITVAFQGHYARFVDMTRDVT